MKPPVHVARDLAPIVLMIATAPLLLSSVAELDSNTEDVRQWLPKSVPQRQAYERFVEHFGVDDVVLVSWPGCTLDDKRLVRLADVLSNPAEHGLTDDLVRQVWTGQGLMHRLTSSPLDLSRREALDRLAGFFVGDDEKTTCLLLEASREGRRNRKAVIETVRRAAEACGVEPPNLRLGGNVAMGVAVDTETMRSFYTLALPSAVVAIVLAGVCLRNLRLIVIVLAASAYAELLALAMVRYSGGQLNSILIAMPTLIFVLTVSGTIHLMTYYRAAVAAGGVEGAAGRALRAAWLPCSLAAVTTAVGMVSLSVSEIDTIRTFGLYSAAGLLGALAVQLGFVPAALDFWPPLGRRAAEGPSVARGGTRIGVSGRFISPVIGHSHAWLVGWMALTLVTAVGFLGVRTSLRLDKFFRPDSRLMQDYRWLERHLGPLEQLELMLRFEAADPEELLNRMQLVAALHDRLREMPDVRAVFSTASYLPALPSGRSVRAVAARQVAASRIAGQRAAFIEEGLITLDGNDELWRVTIRVSALEGVDYPRLADQVRQVVASIIQERLKQGGGRVDATCTGMWPLFYQGQRLLLRDLTLSFLAAIAMITPMLMLAFWSIGAGLLAMLPNVAPIVIVYGTVGWLGIPIDIGTVVTASVAIGMSVDGTLHFVLRYRRSHRASASQDEAIREAFGHCAPVMSQTAIICGLSLLVFSASVFLPTARFAWLLLFTLLAALVADLMLLPAILASRLGRWF